MPNREKHNEQYRHNLNFLSFVCTEPLAEKYVDWKITVMFYAILHRVDEILAGFEGGYHPSDHKTRNGYIRMVTIFKPIRVEYELLSSYCHAARYRCNITKENLTKAQSVFDHVTNTLDSMTV